MHHNYGVVSESHACRNYVWHTILDAELHATYPGERVLVAHSHQVQLPLYECIAIALRIIVLSVRFIVHSVVQCYLVHWINYLPIAQPVMRV